MSNAELIETVKGAIAEAEAWSVKGWDMAFGMHRTEINSLEEAEKTPRNAVVRDEAMNYWRMIKRTGDETVTQGNLALAALEQGDVVEAMRAVYFAMFKERQLLERTTTWGPAFKALQAAQ